MSERQPFVMVPEAVLDEAELTALQVRVFALLAKHAGRKATCWPGVRKLAGSAGCSTRSITRAINELCARGLVRRTRRGLGQTNLYSLQMEPSSKPSTSTQEATPVSALVATPVSPEEVNSEEPERTLFASLSESASIDERRCSEATDYRSLFGAFCTSIGRQPQGTVERGRWGKGVKALVGEATCEQVEQAVAEYRRRHPDLPCNPQAVAGQMSDLLQPRPMIRQPVAFDQRFSARARAGAESRAFEELGAAIAASKERSSRAGEGLVRLFGEDAPRLAAGGDRTRDGAGVVGDDAAMELRRLLAGD